MEVFEFEEMKQSQAITCIDIDGETLRLAVVSGGAIYLYAAGQISTKVTQEIGKYQGGHPVVTVKWSHQPYTYTSDLLGDYLLSIGKQDGSLTILRRKDPSPPSHEDWVACCKSKPHTSAVVSLSWSRNYVVSAGKDNNIVVHRFEYRGKAFSLQTVRTIGTGMQRVGGVCCTDMMVFAMVRGR